MIGWYLGIDVGGTTTRAGLSSGTGLAARASAATPATLDAFLDTIAALCRELGASGVRGVGMGLPGVVTETGGSWVPNVRYLATPGLGAAVAERVGAPVTLGNDAQLALLGEAREGAASGCASALLVSVGTGIGGAVMVGGRIMRGAHGSAGAMGWAVVDTADPGDPEIGALERRASGRALERAGAALDPPRDSYALIDAARAGDSKAHSVVSRAGRDLGAAIAGVGSVVDPEVVLVSGGLTDAFDVLEPAIMEAVSRWGSPQLREVPVRVAALGSDAGLRGALHAAREGGDAWW